MAGSFDQVDVNVKIVERPTGQVQAGAGYSSSEGLVLQASYSQQNTFGTGHAVSFEVNTSQVSRTLSLTHTDPYVTRYGVSRTTELIYRKSDLAELSAPDLTSLENAVKDAEDTLKLLQIHHTDLQFRC